MTMIVEDYAALHRRRAALRLRCAIRQQQWIGLCWCYCQGRDGAHLPCPDAPAPPTPDPLAETRSRIRELFGPPFYAR